MDEKQAKELIGNLFSQAFDRQRYEHFLRNLLNHFEPRNGHYSGNYIPDAYKEHVSQYWRVGKYVDPDGEELDLLIVEVPTLSKLERARSALRNFAVSRLKRFEKDASLIAFFAKDDGGEDWRFSFVKIEHEAYRDEKSGKVKVKQELTPARRYSYLVGVHENSHTAAKQLLPILAMDYADPRVGEIEAAFSVEKVSKEFFEQYKQLFLKLAAHLKQQPFFQRGSEEEADRAVSRFAKKLLGQIVFLYFLQKKGWLGVPKNRKWGEGSKRFMRKRFDQVAQNGGNYFHDFLEPLFYEALAKERKGGDDPDYYPRFDCKIPFLNGGLFEAEYDWEKEIIDLPNELFHNNEKNKTGDKGTGILDVFDRYNFTIKEDEPLEREVAIDPEMLGKVFENMLEITERKKKGAFYTPREIVHYMCRESLVYYLEDTLSSLPSQGGVSDEVGGGGLNNLPNLKTLRKRLRNNLTPAEAALWKLLKGKKLKGRKFRRQHSVGNYILDFYCPSEKLAVELDGEAHNTLEQAEYDRERDLFLTHTGIKVLRFENRIVFDNPEGLLQQIESQFGWSKTHAADHPALRAPLLNKEGSICVPREDLDLLIRNGHLALENDQRVVNAGKETDTYKFQLPETVRKHAKDIDEALANIKICDPAIGSGAFPVGLLHEIVNARLALAPHSGNTMSAYELKRHAIRESIYGVDMDASAIDIARLRLWLSMIVDEENYDNIEPLPNLDYKIVQGDSLLGIEVDLYNVQLFNRLEAKKKAFFDTTNREEKERLNKEIELLISEITNGRELFDFKVYFSEVWHQKGGFDVVIGNPPYLRIQGIRAAAPEKADAYRKLFTSATGSFDLYVLFLEKGMELINESGILNFIMPDKWINASFGKGIRKIVSSRQNLQKLISFGAHQVFSASTYSSLVWIVHRRVDSILYLKLEPTGDDTTLEAALNSINNNRFSANDFSQLSEQPWILVSGRNAYIMERLKSVTRRLSIIFEKIFQGIASSKDSVYFLRNAILENGIYEADSLELGIRVRVEEGLVKPLLLGDQVHRYQPLHSDNVVIFPYLIDRNAGPKLMTEEYIAENFPKGYAYLKKCEEILRARERGKLKDDPGWFRYIYPKNLMLFNRPKLIAPDISLGGNYAYDRQGTYYMTTTLYGYIKKENIWESYEYWLALLNSSLLWFYLQNTGSVLANGYYRYKPAYLKNIPIPDVDKVMERALSRSAAYLLNMNSHPNNNKLPIAFFEQLIDGLVYELYFPDELKAAGKVILPHIGELEPITDDMSEGEKLAVIQREFDRLYDPSHPVRNNLETLDSVEVVRIIRDALKK